MHQFVVNVIQNIAFLFRTWFFDFSGTPFTKLQYFHHESLHFAVSRTFVRTAIAQFSEEEKWTLNWVQLLYFITISGLLSLNLLIMRKNKLQKSPSYVELPSAAVQPQTCLSEADKSDTTVNNEMNETCVSMGSSTPIKRATPLLGSPSKCISIFSVDSLTANKVKSFLWIFNECLIYIFRLPLLNQASVHQSIKNLFWLQALLLIVQ